MSARFSLFAGVLAVVVVVAAALAPPALGEVRVDGNSVTFRLYAPDARSVHLAGSFNNWSTTATPMQGPDPHGYWSVTLTLPDGRHEYKFVVDGGRWVEDPQAMDRSPDGYGGFNSVVYVGIQPPARLNMDVSAELILKLEQIGQGNPVNNYNDLILTLDGSVHPNLDAYGKFKVYKGFTPVENIRDLDWAPDWAGLEEASTTFKVGPLSLIGSWKVHAGDAGDPWKLFQANNDEDDFWGDNGYYRTELLLNAGPAGGRLGFIRGKDRVIFGRAWLPLRGLTFGAVGTYHTWEDKSRSDGEDHNLVYGGYVDGDVTPWLGVTAEWLRSQGTKLVVTEGAPSEVTFTFVQDPHAREVWVQGSWDDWATETPLKKDPSGFWKATMTLEPGLYEYVFRVVDSEGDVQWYKAGDGGPDDNIIRYAQDETETFAFANLPDDVTEVWLRGNMPGVGWDPGLKMEKTPEGYWVRTVSGLEPREIYLWKVYYVRLNGKDGWHGKGDHNLQLQVGSGVTEQPKRGDALWAEVRLKPAPFDVKLGTKMAQPEFNAEFSDIGSNFREHYVTAGYAVVPALRLEAGYSLRTDYAGSPSSRTDTVTPAIEVTKPVPWVESARLAYSYKSGVDSRDESTFKATLTPLENLRIETEEKWREDGWWSANAKLTGSLPGSLELTYEHDPASGRKAKAWWERAIVGGLTGKLGYEIEPGKADKLHTELVYKLNWATSPEISLAHETRERKTTFQVKLLF